MTNTPIPLLRLLLSVIISIVLIVITLTVKRNSDHIYYVKFRISNLAFALSIFILSGVFSADGFKSFFPSFLAVVLLGSGGIFVLFEHAQIKDNQLIITHTPLRPKILYIDDIATITFRTFAGGDGSDIYIDFKTKQGLHVKIKSEIEDAAGFLSELKQINPSIEIPDEIYPGDATEVIMHLAACIFLAASINRFISFIFP